MELQLARIILPEWARTGNKPPVIERELSIDEIINLNCEFYNIYYLPNGPSEYTPGKTVDGFQIDKFNYVFVDMDLKDNTYPSKEAFIEYLVTTGPMPTQIVDSGGGVHAYWKVTDLDALSYLRLSRRLMRKFKTDEAVGKIYQLMRLPGTINTKREGDFRSCEEIYIGSEEYTCEQLDSLLPPISKADEDYCKLHFENTYRLKGDIKVSTVIPNKFNTLIESSKEAKEIWLGNVDDRSKGDYRLAHLMNASGFTRDEAMSVLVNSAKALSRAPQHQIAYAANIVDKVWTFENSSLKLDLSLSNTVAEILARGPETHTDTPLPCWRYLDATEHGFRLGQIIGLVAGSGVGKTAVALNMFMGFVTLNPDFDHFFIPLEQPANEIADRWKLLCGDNVHLHNKVHVMSNYAPDGSFRHLSLKDIQDYILKFQSVTGKKVGCVVIDHIGALRKKGAKAGEGQDLMDICHMMKAFAVATNTLLVMQSQAPREKAGIGDLELSKDAAYGTVFFESYCDYLMAIWQPLKRCYSEPGCPTVTAFKMCKIRHKNQKKDKMQEDVRYLLYFDPDKGHLRSMTQSDPDFSFWNARATNARKQDRKTDILTYESIPWDTKEDAPCQKD